MVIVVENDNQHLDVPLDMQIDHCHYHAAP